MQNQKQNQKAIYNFMLALVFIAIAGGLSSSVYSNYFKDAYDVTSLQRGFIEIPRETPGILCMFAVSLLGFLGNINLSIISQLMVLIGIFGMAFFSPSYSFMLFLLFINSFGQHLFMPLNDSIAMSLGKEGYVGSTMGKLKGISTLASMATAVVVFIGFKFGVFSFKDKIILPFAIAFVLTAMAVVCLINLRKYIGNENKSKKFKLLIRKQYWPYYLLTFAYGAQKRIHLVFAPWVLIELLKKGADTLSLLMIVTHFAGTLFAPALGKMLDKTGLKKTLLFEALYLIIVFCTMGTLAEMVSKGTINTGLTLVIFILYILCELFSQFNMVHSYLMKKIAINDEEVTQSLSVGLSVDHVVAIVVSSLLGIVWNYWGVGCTFYIVAAFSVVQIFVAFIIEKRLIKPTENKE